MNDEFKFQISGTNELITFAELEERLAVLAKYAIEETDRDLKWHFQHELDSVERRLVEVFDRRLQQPSTDRLQAKEQRTSIGKMKLHDIMIKFR